jgi:prevent-host-death family protein
MKTATVRDLRNHYTSLLDWISAGEEIVITRRGKAIARLVPEQAQATSRVDWSQSPAVARDRTNSRVMSAEESQEIVHDAAGRW